jgi:hypothetical protein
MLSSHFLYLVVCFQKPRLTERPFAKYSEISACLQQLEAVPTPFGGPRMFSVDELNSETLRHLALAAQFSDEVVSQSSKLFFIRSFDGSSLPSTHAESVLYKLNRLMFKVPSNTFMAANLTPFRGIPESKDNRISDLFPFEIRSGKLVIVGELIFAQEAILVYDPLVEFADFARRFGRRPRSQLRETRTDRG